MHIPSNFEIRREHHAELLCEVQKTCLTKGSWTAKDRRGGRLLEMERVGSHRTKEAVSSLESDEAIHLTPIPLAHRSHEGEAPELVAGYLGRIGRGELLTKEDWSSLARSGPEI